MQAVSNAGIDERKFLSLHKPFTPMPDMLNKKSSAFLQAEILVYCRFTGKHVSQVRMKRNGKAEEIKSKPCKSFLISRDSIKTKTDLFSSLLRCFVIFSTGILVLFRN